MVNLPSGGGEWVAYVRSHLLIALPLVGRFLLYEGDLLLDRSIG